MSSFKLMTNILLVQKGGDIKQTKVKNLTNEVLYKKCGFRKADDFDKRTTWVVVIEGTKYYIELWARDNGKANTENKYDFPPPVDTKLYFGTCCLVSINPADGKYLDLEKELWEKIYEKLFGGFENLDSEEEMSEDELEKIPQEMKTKNGYLKDGFVVEDNLICNNDDEDNDDENEDDDEELENLVLTIEEDDDDEDDDGFVSKEEEEEDGSGSELMAEAYEYSDED